MQRHSPLLGQDDRLIKEQGLESRIASLIIEPLATLGYRLVRIRLSNLNNHTLQIMAERPDYSFTIDDCEIVSRSLSPLLDEARDLPASYNLEVSSPGMDRPLVRLADFQKWVGHVAKVETINLMEERKRFRGKIADVSPEGFSLIADADSDGQAKVWTIPFSNYESGRLVLTDDLIRETLRQDKERQKALDSTNFAGE